MICYNPLAMDGYEYCSGPCETVVSAKGDGPAIDISGASNRVFLVTLAITKIIEQESLDLSIYGSATGCLEREADRRVSAEILLRRVALLLDLTRIQT